MEQDLQLLAGQGAFEQFTRRAKKGCKHCYGRGYQLFDDPSKLQRWIQPCVCTHNRSLRKLLHRKSTKYDSR